MEYSFSSKNMRLENMILGKHETRKHETRKHETRKLETIKHETRKIMRLGEEKKGGKGTKTKLELCSAMI